MAEKRRDPTNPPSNRAKYSYSQFVDFYGQRRGTQMWERAGAGGGDGQGPERRADPTNPPESKKTYTRAQFVDFYGAEHGAAMWRKARSAAERSAAEDTRHFKDPWFRQFPKTDVYRCSNGFRHRIPIRLESRNIFLHGSAELAPVRAAFEGEELIPISVGGKACVNVWFNDFTDTDCCGPYRECFIVVSCTQKKDGALDVPAEMGPASYVVDAGMNPKLKDAVPVTYRVWCETKAPILGGREVWGFPKYPKPVDFDITYPNGTMTFAASNEGEPIIKMVCKRPGGDPIPIDAKTPKMYCPVGWNTSKSAAAGQHDGCAKFTEYSTNAKCTSYVAPWDPETDTLDVFGGKDWWLGAWLHKWKFEPAMKVWVPDFKIVAHKPNGWLPAAEPHDYWPIEDPKAEAALKRAGMDKASGGQEGDEHHFKDEWFRKFPKTDVYRCSSGFRQRLPIRLESQNIFLHGSAELEPVRAAFAGEELIPISVGGKACVNVWFNDFTDTDCCGPYRECFIVVSCTQKKDGPLDVPAEMGPASYVVDAALNPKLKAAVPVTYRVWCETKAPILSREIWGFPKYAKPVDFEVNAQSDGFHFSASNDGAPIIKMVCKKPGGDPVPVEAHTPKMYTVGGWTKQHDGVPKPTEYSTDAKCTSYVAPWDPETDKLDVYDGKDWWLGSWLHSWKFEPAMKVWVPDFKIVAHKPNGWLPASEPHDYWPVGDAPKEQANLKAAGGRGGLPAYIPGLGRVG